MVGVMIRWAMRFLVVPLLAFFSMGGVPDLEAENQRLRRYNTALEIYEASLIRDHWRLENED